MDFEAIISFFFGRTFLIICTIRTERTAESGTPKLIDRKGKAVDHIILACSSIGQTYYWHSVKDIHNYRQIALYCNMNAIITNTKKNIL